MISLNVGLVEKNENGLLWNQTPDNRFQVKVDPLKGVDPMNDDALDLFLSSVRDSPRLVKQNFFLIYLFFLIQKIFLYSTRLEMKQFLEI